MEHTTLNLVYIDHLDILRHSQYKMFSCKANIHQCIDRMKINFGKKYKGIGILNIFIQKDMY